MTEIDRGTETMNLEHSAIHEAAHTVIAKAEGAVVREVWVRPDFVGNSSHWWPSIPWEESEREREGNRATAKIAIAGLLGEFRLSGRGLETFLACLPKLRAGVSCDDVALFERCAEGSGHDQEELIRECEREVARLFEAVREIAGELARRARPPYVLQTHGKGVQSVVTSISGAEADRIVREAVARCEKTDAGRMEATSGRLEGESVGARAGALPDERGAR